MLILWISITFYQGYRVIAKMNEGELSHDLEGLYWLNEENKQSAIKGNRLSPAQGMIPESQDLPLHDMAAIEKVGKERKPDLERFSVMLLGIDAEEDHIGRTDAIIVVTVNSELGSIKMLSIPRDARVDIVGRHTTEKINHAYAYGGIKMTKDTVENLLNIPIDFYVAVNMKGFQEIIDIVGGIKVKNEIELKDEKDYFPKGELALNGDEALRYSRIRHLDPEGDFGRQKRQQIVIRAILDRVAKPSILLKLNDLMREIGAHVRMNYSLEQLLKLRHTYQKVKGDIQIVQFRQGHASIIDELWYYIIDESELQTIQKSFADHLDIEGVL